MEQPCNTSGRRPDATLIQRSPLLSLDSRIASKPRNRLLRLTFFCCGERLISGNEKFLRFCNEERLHFRTPIYFILRLCEETRTLDDDRGEVDQRKHEVQHFRGELPHGEQHVDRKEADDLVSRPERDDAERYLCANFASGKGNPVGDVNEIR